MNDSIDPQLHDADQLYRLVVRSLRDHAVFTIDLRRRIVSWNPGAQALFGYEAEEVLGQPVHIFFTSEDQTAGEPEQELEQAKRTGHASDQRWHVRRNGTLFWAEGVVNPLCEEDGKTIGFVKIVRDLTELKRTQEQLQALAESLEQRVIERTEQVHTMATKLSQVEHRERRRIADDLHDSLAQLLVSCQMKLSLIEPADESSHELIGELKQALRDTLEYTRTLIADLRPTVLFEQGLPTAVRWLAGRMRERFGLEVEVTAEEKALEELPEDVSQVLFYAVRELLVNVVKHADSQEAKVALCRRQGRVQVTVADRGVGFRMDANQQAGAPPERGGYGLFSVRERIHLVGGEIDVQSRDGEGSQITLTIPLAAERWGYRVEAG